MMMTDHKKQAEEEALKQQAMEDIIDELGLTEAQLRGALRVFEALEKTNPDQKLCEITDAQLRAAAARSKLN
jgi:hypothetical protein